MVGIEHIRELVELSERNVGKQHADWLTSGRIKFVTGDGRKGFPEDGPYDCMYVYTPPPKSILRSSIRSARQRSSRIILIPIYHP